MELGDRALEAVARDRSGAEAVAGREAAVVLVLREDDLGVGGYVALGQRERGQEGHVGVGAGEGFLRHHTEHGAEAQLGGLADQVEGPLLLVDAGELHEEVVALGGYLGLGHPEAVDPGCG